MSDTFDTLLNTVRAVFTVVFIYFCGFLIAKFKIVDRNGVKVLSKLSQFVFLPLLLFLRLGGKLNVENFIFLWKMPLIGISITFLNFLIARFVLVPIFKPTKSFQHFYVLGLTFTNNLSLPLVLLRSVCSQVSFEKPSFSKEIGNETLVFSEEECAETAELYIFMYRLLISFVLWTFGLQYALSGVKMEEVVEKQEKEENLEDENFKKKLILFCKPFRDFLKRLLNPIMIGQVLGLIVGLIPFVQNLLFSEDSFFDPLLSAAELLSEATVSVVNLILSISLSIKVLELKRWSDIFGNEDTLGASKKTIVSMTLGKMLLQPLILYSFLWVLDYFVFDLSQGDDLMKFITFIELVPPSANMSVLLAHVVGQVNNAEILGVSILLQYFFGVFSITGSVFLTLKTMNF